MDKDEDFKNWIGKDGIIIFPKELEKIDENLVYKIGTYAFNNYVDIVGISFEEGSRLKEIEKGTFEGYEWLRQVDLSNCKKLEIIGDRAFLKCVNLKEIDLSSCENLEKINFACFECCENLESVKVDGLKKLKEVGDYCFGHTALNEFVAPKGRDCSELTFGETVFSCCSQLTKVDFSNSKLTDLRGGVFLRCENLKEVNFRNSNLKKIASDCFIECKLDCIDFRGVDKLNAFLARGGCIDTNNVLFSERLNWFSFASFNQIFKKGANISFYNKENIISSFIVSENEPLSKCRIGGIYLKKKLEENGVKLKYNEQNALFSEKEISILLDKKGLAQYSKMLKELSEGGCKINLNIVAFLRLLGYFGFEDYKTGKLDKAKVDDYKILLARDLVYSKIKKEVKCDTNKDYINKIVNEKVLKVAKNYSLNDLVYSFVMNNIASNKHKEDLFQALPFVLWTREKYIELAQFMVLHFDEIMKKKIVGKDWEHHEINDDFDDINDDGSMSFPEIILKFNKILSESNKKVVTRSDKNRLTLADFECGALYEGVTQENEQLAKLCLKAHIDKKGFEFLNDLFEKGKALKDEQVLKVCEDKFGSKQSSEENLITYQVIEKDNPIGLVLGNITNCCQCYDSAGEDCMIVGQTNVNSGFVTFNQGDKILGQGWIWYDPKTFTLAIDNIEVPEVKEKVVNKDKKVEMANCLQRFCKNAFDTMNKNGHKVLNVIIGKANTDVKCLDDLYNLETCKEKLIDCPFSNEKGKVYSDIAKNGQYVVYRGGKRVFLEPETVEENIRFKE